MKTRPLMVSLAVALASVAAYEIASTREVRDPNPSATAPSEPAGPLNAGAVLEDIVGTESRPQARVRVSLTSLLTDADAWVQAEPRRPGDQPVRLGSIRLLRGERRDLRAVLDLEPGRDNLLHFTAGARKPDGGEEKQSIYLDVNLDPDTKPVEVDEYIEYRGAVEKTGGAR